MQLKDILKKDAIAIDMKADTKESQVHLSTNGEK